MNNENLAYLAGFFEADGYVSIVSYGTRRLRFSLRAGVVQNVISVCRRYREEFGGYIYRLKGGAWNWEVTCENAKSFLLFMLPYLRLKHKEARLAISFQESMYRHGSPGLSEEEFAKQEADYEEMKRLKGCRE